MRESRKKKRESGQSTLEYVLVMAVVLTVFVAANSMLKKNQYFFNHITKPLVVYMRYNYKYADAQAQGWDEQPGNARKHIQMSGGQSFRLFRGVRK